MSPLQTAAFLVLSLVIVYSAFRVVTTVNVTHAALYLGVTFIGVAGIYLLLQAEFLAAIQILVYVGAILTVTIFAIMLSKLPDITGQRDQGLLEQLRSNRWGYVPLLVAAVFVAVILYGYSQIPTTATGTTVDSSIASIGQALFTQYVVPFEIASVLLTAAMIGAIVLTRKRGEN